MDATPQQEVLIGPPKKRRAGPGRPPGGRNKITLQVKDAITFAADELGGARRLVEWAREHPDNEFAFWTRVYPKLLPLQVAGTPGEPMVFRFQWSDK